MVSDKYVFRKAAETNFVFVFRQPVLLHTEDGLLATRPPEHRLECNPNTATATAVNPSASSGQPPSSYTCCNAFVDGVHRVFGLFCLQTTDARRWKMCTLITVFFITTLPTYNFSVQTLFAMNHPLCWGLSQVGFFTGISLGKNHSCMRSVYPLKSHLHRCPQSMQLAF